MYTCLLLLNNNFKLVKPCLTSSSAEEWGELQPWTFAHEFRETCICSIWPWIELVFELWEQVWVPVSITTVVCLKLRPAASNSFSHMSPTRCPGSSGPRCSRRAGVRTICSPWPLVSVEWELCSGIKTIATELSLTLLSLIDFQLAESGGSLQSDGGSRIFHHHFCDCVAYFNPQQRLCPAGCKSDIFFTDPIFNFFLALTFSSTALLSVFLC